MVRYILIYGVIAGIVVGVPLSVMTLAMSGHAMMNYGMLIGYLTMLIALSAVFLAIKRHRDIDLGGVIKFWPALVLGLGVSVVAGVIYVIAWEVSCAVAHADFAGSYAKAMIAQQEAKGVSGAALDRIRAEMEQFKVQYANPLYRWPETFAEIFPVGVIVSLVSAAFSATAASCRRGRGSFEARHSQSYLELNRIFSGGLHGGIRYWRRVLSR